MSKPYNTRSSEAGDVSQESSSENTDTTTTTTAAQPVDMAALAQMIASLKADLVNKIDTTNTKIDATSNELAATNASIATTNNTIASTNESLKTEIANTSKKHSTELSQISIRLTTEFNDKLNAFADKIQADIVQIDQTLQQQREDLDKKLLDQKQQLLSEQEAGFLRQKLETQFAIDQSHKFLIDNLDNSERLTDIKITQKFNEASSFIKDSREETLVKLEKLRHDHQQSLDSINKNMEEQESVQHMIGSEVEDTKRRTDTNTINISELQTENKKLDTKISHETNERFRTMEEMKQAEEERIRKLEKELQRIKQISTNIGSCTGTRSYLRHEMIPKFSGNRDRLHPMT